MSIKKLRESIRRIILQELNENLTIKGKKVKTYKQNGDKSYAVVYDDGTKATIMVSDKEWDTLNDAPKLSENSPAPSKPRENPGPAIAPGKPGEKDKPRRPLGNPNVKPAPKAKATMDEAEMLAKIIKRFKSKKNA
jgi:hypothetical protein